MNETSPLQSLSQIKLGTHSLGTRSMGVKLIVVCVLALLMTIPSLFVVWLVSDRSQRAATVVNEISGHVGGQQTFLGPTLAIPFVIPARSASDVVKRSVYLVFPTEGSTNVQVSTEERRRSLFKVPVYQANLKMDATFDLSGVPAELPEGAVLDWNRAELVVGVTDARGAAADATIAAGSKAATLVPAATSTEMTFGNDVSQRVRLTLFGTYASTLAKPGAQFRVSANLHFTGAQRIALLAYGKSTRFAVQSNWPNPSFDGGFLPASRTISPSGFTGQWSVPFIARGVRAEGPIDTITGLEAAQLGVSLVEVADPYQSVNRALKYVLLFLGLVFLSYFVFEVTTGKHVHPAQYILVGVAQIIFYLLLLSLAERVGFDWGFLIAGGATAGLLAANAGWIFHSRLQGLRALAVFSLLYGLIYLLLRLEDNALLVGAVASFVAVAAAMYFTRKIDWYSSLPPSQPNPPNPSSNKPEPALDLSLRA
ncbi:MAG: cell envelope integrity protein CreD [Terracidiphilus sp.]|nr:cell envelope integrity protein CreD [Terracidiphilus sp.]